MMSAMRYRRMPIEVESPEEYGYGNIRYNLSESSIADQSLASFDVALPDLVLLYGEHRGNASLRELVAADDPDLSVNDVLICGGAAGALFIVATSLLGRDDHLVVVRPNYATNLETPRAIGCDISFIDLAFEEAFVLDPGRIESAIKPSTKLVSITCPHNPTGASISEADCAASSRSRRSAASSCSSMRPIASWRSLHRFRLLRLWGNTSSACRHSPKRSGCPAFASAGSSIGIQLSRRSSLPQKSKSAFAVV